MVQPSLFGEVTLNYKKRPTVVVLSLWGYREMACCPEMLKSVLNMGFWKKNSAYAKAFATHKRGYACEFNPVNGSPC